MPSLGCTKVSDAAILPQRPYSAHRRFRLSATLTILILGFASGGCTYRLGSMAGRDASPERTASISAPMQAKSGGERGAENDLAIAKAAATEVLAAGKKDASRPWENPRTGARGTVTPIATVYSQDGFTCRNFLASRVHDEKETWYQGGACRVHNGRWEVRDIRPLQRT
jgi:surface antigen